MSARTPLSALFDRVSVLDREQNLGPLRALMAALAAAPDVDDGKLLLTRHDWCRTPSTTVNTQTHQVSYCSLIKITLTPVCDGTTSWGMSTAIKA